MWTRMRLDIRWADLAYGLISCAQPGSRERMLESTRLAWNECGDSLITLSVRSGLDLLFRTLQLPAGSEVLMTALTVPDMVRIVRAHGLVPVPVEVDSDGRINVDSFAAALTGKSKVFVVAHLFGGKASLEEVLPIARRHGLAVVEDCAQSFREVGERGHADSTAVMYSFGPIKTATALGGAVVTIRSTELRDKMHAVLSEDPVQSRFSFFKRVVRFALLKAATGRRCSAMLRCVVESFGFDFDSIATSSAKGFPQTTDSITPFRKQPSLPLLRVMRRRWKYFDRSGIDRRIKLGRNLDSRIGLTRSKLHTYWVYPVFVHRPQELVERLRLAGYDATRQSRMALVPSNNTAAAVSKTDRAWSRVVFLPWYSDLTDDAISEMGDVVNDCNLAVTPTSLAVEIDVADLHVTKV
ncbi:MAG: aminotransferase class I/II-fold pyridoxal phosphate-dependent enzyme [Planctomycetota bacterium]